MSHFRLSHQAKADLHEIAAYIGDRNPLAAGREVRRLSDRFTLLAKNPLLGETRNDLRHDLRGFAAGNYLILYTPTANGIEVARVVHAARDLGSIPLQE